MEFLNQYSGSKSNPGCGLRESRAPRIPVTPGCSGWWPVPSRSRALIRKDGEGRTSFSLSSLMDDRTLLLRLSRTPARTLPPTQSCWMGPLHPGIKHLFDQLFIHFPKMWRFQDVLNLVGLYVLYLTVYHFDPKPDTGWMPHSVQVPQFSPPCQSLCKGQWWAECSWQRARSGQTCPGSVDIW